MFVNEYHCYEKICSLKKIAAQYNAGMAYEKMLQSMADDIAQQTYRVAFIGEFKRGKSSLINALLGTDVLPMDILPMTASVIRICHGAERRIFVHFKDGHSEEHTLEDLADFATKDSAKHREIADKVREIEVVFPSVLGRSHIEILDTPGINDDTDTTRKTMGVIGQIDAAVVVVSAKYPISITEQNLILELIRAEDIRRIVFAVTFIDLLETDIGKKQALEFIINTKLKQMVLAQAKLDFAENPSLKKKAEKLLSDPIVFGVSSLQARQGIQKGDLQLLTYSNIPFFKDELLTILLGGMEESVPAKTFSAIKLILSLLPSWQRDESSRLEQQRVEQERKFEQQNSSRIQRIKEIRENLIEWLHELDKYLKTKGLSVRHGFDRSCEKPLCKIFISQLSTITHQNNTHQAVLSAMQYAMSDAGENMSHISEMMKGWMIPAMDSLSNHLNKKRQSVGLNDDELNIKLKEYRSTHHFPPFGWAVNPVSKCKDLDTMDVMPIIEMSVKKSVEAFSDGLSEYLAGWRLVLFRQLDSDETKIKMNKNCSSQNDSIRRKIEALPFLYRQHIEMLKEMEQSFNVYNESF